MNVKEPGLLLSVVVCSVLAAFSADAGAKSKGKKARSVPLAQVAPAAPAAPSATGVIPDHGHGPGGVSEGVTSGGNGVTGGPTDVLVIWGPESTDLTSARRPMVLEQFDSIDTDDDGLLSKAELATHFADVAERMRESMEGRFEAGDVDGSGTLDLAEVQTAMPCLAESFSKLDVDGDGYLELDELPLPAVGN